MYDVLCQTYNARYLMSPLLWKINYSLFSHTIIACCFTLCCHCICILYYVLHNVMYTFHCNSYHIHVYCANQTILRQTSTMLSYCCSITALDILTYCAILYTKADLVKTHGPVYMIKHLFKTFSYLDLTTDKSTCTV